MKLIHCRKCKDVVRLIHQEWRTCYCGKSGGQYNEDLMTATVGGDCDIVGISNLFFDPKFKTLTEKQKVRYRKKINHFTSEIWYGEIGCGDNQIHRIKSPNGPKLKGRVEWIDETHTKFTITDKRKYSICCGRPKFVIVENEMKPSFKGNKPTNTKNHESNKRH